MSNGTPISPIRAGRSAYPSVRAVGQSELTGILVARIAPRQTAVLVRIALQLAQLPAHVLLDARLADLDGLNDFALTTLNPDRVLVPSDSIFIIWKVERELELTALNK